MMEWFHNDDAEDAALDWPSFKNEEGGYFSVMLCHQHSWLWPERNIIHVDG